jgi:arsenate reductase (glutaredoxin)
MVEATIYHNPRCSKSRQTLDLLREHGVEPDVVLYLSDPPDRATLAKLLNQLSLSAEQVVRQKEFKALGEETPAGQEGWLDLLTAHPAIIERPIVVVNGQAVLGRPPENVLKLLS